MRSRLQDLYESKIKGELQKELGLANPFSTPKLTHIVISTTNKDISDTKKLDHMFDEMFKIAGQKPVITKAKKSIAAFKVREGMPVGLRVTLRGSMMYHFLDRLVNLALPRSKDFRGINPNKFDGNGNFSMGIKEQLIFPEIDYDNTHAGIYGMNININTTASDNDSARLLLSKFNLPFDE